ncbi:MAG: hypothetical protein D6805_06660 [Planctomycetota bacterium]|nr:MAG: hypothetical protein D6805_06660 [Planctomycetota bacterium]
MEKGALGIQGWVWRGCFVFLFASWIWAEPVRPRFPRYIYLTWTYRDTAHTMTVHYLTFAPTSSTEIYYALHSSKSLRGYSFHQYGFQRRLANLPRFVHTLELTHLRPNTVYYFRVGSSQGGFSGEKKFRTLAEGKFSLCFVVGGDMGSGAKARRLCKVAASYDPMFAVIGGDIAYADGRVSAYREWDRWLELWTSTMITTEGCLIPVIVAIGNHEVRKYFYLISSGRAPFYFGYFYQSPQGRSYFVRVFGESGVLFILDSGHIFSHNGVQLEWMRRTMEKYAHFPHRFAVYHVPLYPSHRGFYRRSSRRGRKYWLPLFDRFHLHACFEHHDHTLKRTKLLRGNRVVRRGGTLYLGDGSWGRGGRSAKKRWYLSTSMSRRHFWLVQASSKYTLFQAIGLENKVLDSVRLSH